jgi:hypothetical protein
MLLNAMVLTLPFPARINELHRTRLTFAIRQKPNTRMGNHVSQNRNMCLKQSQFWQRPAVPTFFPRARARPAHVNF